MSSVILRAGNTSMPLLIRAEAGLFNALFFGGMRR